MGDGGIDAVIAMVGNGENEYVDMPGTVNWRCMQLCIKADEGCLCVRSEECGGEKMVLEECGEGENEDKLCTCEYRKGSAASMRLNSLRRGGPPRQLSFPAKSKYGYGIIGG
jgi:hypothetical protein